MKFECCFRYLRFTMVEFRPERVSSPAVTAIEKMEREKNGITPSMAI
jgi:hypothetical protein